MSLVYLGSLTVGEAVPGGVFALAEALPRVQAELAGAVSLQAQLIVTPPTIADSLVFAQQLVASIQAQIALGIQLPSVAVQLPIVEALIATLQVSLNGLLLLQNAFSTVGVHAYAYEGQVNAMGSQVSSAFAGGLPGGLPNDYANALVLVTSIPATWAAIGRVLKTS